MPPTIADGSSAADREPTVTIDPGAPSTRWRFTCGEGHSTIEPTNGGVWCRSCANNPGIEDPHYHEIWDNLEERSIPWSSVRVRGRE